MQIQRFYFVGQIYEHFLFPFLKDLFSSQPT